MKLRVPVRLRQVMAQAPQQTRTQLAFVTAYFSAYVCYLFVHPEGELLHWATLVVVPLAGLAAIGPDSSPRSLVRSIGLDSARALNGLGWVVLLGAAFQVLQLLNARQRLEFFAIVAQPFGVLLPLGAIVLLVGTVATTEEVFFRGILQTRVAAASQRPLAAVLVTTAAFVVYHLPYAYLNPSWPSAGDFAQAVRLAATNGTIGGLALGLVFWRSGENLAAAILLHALIDLIPATRLVGRILAVNTS